jgi:hypothetical protein
MLVILDQMITKNGEEHIKAMRSELSEHIIDRNK